MDKAAKQGTVSWDTYHWGERLVFGDLLTNCIAEGVAFVVNDFKLPTPPNSLKITLSLVFPTLLKINLLTKSRAKDSVNCLTCLTWLVHTSFLPSSWNLDKFFALTGELGQAHMAKKIFPIFYMGENVYFCYWICDFPQK